MKRIFVILAFILCWIPCHVSYAKDFVTPMYEAGSKDDNGVYTSGTCFVTSDIKDDFDFQYQINGTGLFIWMNKSGTRVVLNGKGIFTVQEFYSSDGVSYKKSTLYTCGDPDPFQFFNFTADELVHHKFYSSLPIFREGEYTKEQLDNYLKNGDLSGAYNKQDLSQPTQDDSVELPKNLRTYGNVFESAIEGVNVASMTPRYNAMTVRWDPPEDIESYSYDVKIQVTYSKCSGTVTGRVPDLTKTESTSADLVVTDYPYANRGTYDLTTGKEISRGDNQPEDFRIDGDTLKKLHYSVEFNNMYPRSLKIWVRNRKGDKCSNWVAVTSNASMPSGSNSKASVEDNNGNKVDNDSYNDTPIDNSKQNTYYETDKNGPNSSETPEFSLSKFLAYLKSGFGLMGSNGLFAFLSRSFSFIPSDIWNLIIAGVAAMIIVGIVNFALKR